MKKYLIFAAAALMMTACDEAIQNDVVGDGGTIHLTATVSSGGGATRASATGNLQDTEFASGKQIFVEAYETGETTPYTSGDYTTGDAGALSGSLRYPANNQAIDLCAYYPNSISSVSDAFAIQTDQREVVNYQASDLMYATKLTNKSSGSDHNLEFNHALTKIVVNIVAGAGLTSDNITTFPGVTAVKIKNTLPNASLVIDNGVITASASTGSAADINITGTGASNVGIIVPQEVPAGAFITLTYNSVDYTYNLPAAKTFEAGKLYTYTFTLAAKGLSLTATSINNWTAGEGGETEIGMESKWTDLTFTVGDANFHMIYVEGGDYVQHWTRYNEYDVTVSGTLTSFYIGQTEVTQALWQAVMGSNPSNWKETSRPVEQVSWNDISNENGFLDRLNDALASQLEAYGLSGREFILPSEAQWQYAAMGGIYSQGYTCAGGNDLNAVAWNSGNASSQTHPVAQKLPNELGLYDMTGNVWEWCRDWFCSSSTIVTSQGTDYCRTTQGDSSYRVVRGGGWYHGSDWCPVSRRGVGMPSGTSTSVGFRLLLQ